MNVMFRERQINTLSSRACDWRAVLLILNSDVFRNDGRVWRHVDLERESIYFRKILKDGTFSGGEHRLLEIAASLFSQEHKINLWISLAYLDEDLTSVALAAIAAFCKGS